VNRIILAIVAYWHSKHPPCARIEAWKRAQEAERRARLRNDTKAIGRAARAKREALHGNLRGASHG